MSHKGAVENISRGGSDFPGLLETKSAYLHFGQLAQKHNTGCYYRNEIVYDMPTSIYFS